MEAEFSKKFQIERFSDNPRKPRNEETKDRAFEIFVGGIPTDTRKEEIKSYFGNFGEVARVVLPIAEGKPEQNKGFCLVKFAHIDNEQLMFEKRAFKLKNKVVRSIA